MAERPEPDAPKRANVGPRRAAESVESRSHAGVAQEPRASWSGVDPAGTPTVVSYLFVNVGPWDDLRGVGESDLPAELDLLIRDSVVTRDGKELITGPEGVLSAFGSPSSAVAAAIDLRMSIASHGWPAGRTVRARMGIHTGESEASLGGPLGLDASRAERIAAVSHLGQIVMSGTTASLLAHSALRGIRTSDLGLHRLKDLGQPERLFQVEEEGSRAEFPPLRSLDNPVMMHNLPERLSSFVGREHEQAEVRDLVLAARMVTVIGPGGAGKTRLALQVAADLLDGVGDGVWLVELAALSDPANVVASIAAALSIQPGAESSLEDALVDCLRQQRMLLLLDNCEHVIEAAAGISDALLKACPKIHVLATSREPLGIEGESVYRIPPLSLPPEGEDDPRNFDAIRLFEERAHANQPHFVLDDSNCELAVSLCRNLDGIPLALELAAARLRSTSLSQIIGHLDDRFRLLTGGSRSALPRQQTLLATVEWSYDLLDSGEQSLLRQLSSFSGDFALETAESLSALVDDDSSGIMDRLGSLVDKSLVVFDSDPSLPRYRLLETIKQFAWARVPTEDGEEPRALLSERHADVYLDLVEQAKPHLRTFDQVEWFDRLEFEHDNIRAALNHLLVDPSQTEKAMRMVTALKWFWQIRSHRVEALDFSTRLSQLVRSDESSSLFATMLSGTGEFLLGVSATQAQGCFERALAIARDIPDKGVAALALSGLASVSGQRGDAETERDLRSQAIDIARANGDVLVLADVLSGPTQPGQHGPRLEEAIGYYDSVGDKSGRYIALLDLGAVSLALGEPSKARGLLEAAMAIGRSLGVGQDQTLLVNLAEICLLEGDYARSKDLYREALRVARRHADARAAQYAWLGLALCATADGDNELAARLHGLADSQLRALGYVWAPENLALAEADRERLKSVMGSDRFEEAFSASEFLDIDQALRLITP